jgi:hypothetical protein
MVPHLIPAKSYFAFLMKFSRRKLVEPVSCAISESVFMVTNITGPKPLQLVSVGVFEGYDVSEKSAHNSRIENCHPMTV